MIVFVVANTLQHSRVYAWGQAVSPFITRLLPICTNMLFALIPAALNTTELIVEGRKKIKESDDSLIRSEKLVAETIDIGTKTAEKLHDQTKQLERVVDDLDQIHFSLKKASRIIRDITRSIATDK